MSETYLLDGEPQPVSPAVAEALQVAPQAPVVPVAITNFQARAILNTLPGSSEGRTLFDDIDDALRAGRDTPDGKMNWQAWEQANEFTRAGALVNALAPSFGLTDEQLDQLFIAAASIEA